MMIRAAILNHIQYAERIQILASQLGLPVINDRSESDVDCLLHYENEAGALSLSIPTQPQWQPFYLDFATGAMNWRREHGGGELLVRAIQGRKKDAATVWDATAGLGRDSFVLAVHGFSVRMFERNPYVAALLKDALQRASQSDDATLNEILSQMILIESNTSNYLQEQIESDERSIELPDVIYLDPMFPESKNSALVKKNMQIFHQLVGNDEDANLLLEPARQIALKRVVVKRPVKAPFLADLKPAYQLTGKAIRFDVYLPA